MKELLAALPDERDNSSELGCFLEVTSTYFHGVVEVDYTCMYDSEHYQQLHSM